MQQGRGGGTSTKIMAYNTNNFPSHSNSAQASPADLHLNAVFATIRQLKKEEQTSYYSKIIHDYYGEKLDTQAFKSNLELKKRKPYLFVINGCVSLQSVSVGKNTDVKLFKDERGIGVTIGAAEELIYLGSDGVNTFFVVQFGQGETELILHWNETTQATKLSTCTKQSKRRQFRKVEISSTQWNTEPVRAPYSRTELGEGQPAFIEPLSSNAFVAEAMQTDLVNENEILQNTSADTHVPYQREYNRVNPSVNTVNPPLTMQQCVSLVILVPEDNQSLKNCIWGMLKQDPKHKAFSHRIIACLSLDPYTPVVAMALAYNERSYKAIRFAVSQAENIIMFGNSSTAEPYVLSSMLHETNLFNFGDPYILSWSSEFMHKEKLCRKSASILDLIVKEEKSNRCFALMVPRSGGYSELPELLEEVVVPRCEVTPIPANLYVCMKFTGIEGKPEEEYREEVLQFFQANGIPATIDTVCRGCVAVLIHGPQWMWWYLEAFKDDIKARFGSDLRSITQIGCNNVTELAKRKDNARFKNDLKRLYLQMSRDNVPDRISNKLAIIFKSLEHRQSNLQCIHKHSSQIMTHNLKSADGANGADEILVVNNTKAIIHQRATKSHQRGIPQLSYHDSQAIEDFDRARKIEPNFTFQDRGKAKRILEDMNGILEDMNGILEDMNGTLEDLNSANALNSKDMFTKLMDLNALLKHLMNVKEFRGSITSDELTEIQNGTELCLTKLNTLNDDLSARRQKIYDEELPTRLNQNLEMQIRKDMKNVVLGTIGGAGMLSTSLTATNVLGGAGCWMVAGIAFPPVLILSAAAAIVTLCTNTYQLSREDARLDRHKLKTLLDVLQRVLQQRINTRDNPRMIFNIQLRWQEDSEVSTCNSCQATFHFFRRKHHCRICLKIFCDSCSQYRVELEGNPVKVRACLQCASSKSEDRFCEM